MLFWMGDFLNTQHPRELGKHADHVYVTLMRSRTMSMGLANIFFSLLCFLFVNPSLQRTHKCVCKSRCIMLVSANGGLVFELITDAVVWVAPIHTALECRHSLECVWSLTTE